MAPTLTAKRTNMSDGARASPGAVGGRVLINRQPNADSDVPPVQRPRGKPRRLSDTATTPNKIISGVAQTISFIFFTVESA
jgi:hypothetical protein